MTDEQPADGADRVVQRECVMGPDISGSYHHYGHLNWWEPDEWNYDYRHPECPVSQLGSTDEKAECTQIAERVTDEDGRGAWFCGWHGSFRVFGYPRRTAAETAQQSLATFDTATSRLEDGGQA